MTFPYQTPHDDTDAIIRNFIAAVAPEVRPEDVLSATNKQDKIVGVRWLLWKLLQETRDWSACRIARRWGMDHTTVSHGLRQSRERVWLKIEKPLPLTVEERARRRARMQTKAGMAEIRRRRVEERASQ